MGIPLGLLLLYLNPWVVVILLPFLIGLSWWLSSKAQALFGDEDPKEVVIDEILGLALAIYLVPFSVSNLFLLFFLFRFFDIWKPFPIRTFEKKFRGGGGIILDDLLAALYAVIVLRAIIIFI